MGAGVAGLIKNRDDGHAHLGLTLELATAVQLALARECSDL